MVVARQVAKRYGDQGIISVSLNPGHSCPSTARGRKLTVTASLYREHQDRAATLRSVPWQKDPGKLRRRYDTGRAATFESSLTLVAAGQNLSLYPAPYGALTQLYAGTMPEALQHNGEVRTSPPRETTHAR